MQKRYIYICKILLQITSGLLENMLEYEQDHHNNEIYCKDLVKKIGKLQDYLLSLSIFVDNPYEDEQIPSESPLFLLPDEILSFVFFSFSFPSLSLPLLISFPSLSPSPFPSPPSPSISPFSLIPFFQGDLTASIIALLFEFLPSPLYVPCQFTLFNTDKYS